MEAAAALSAFAVTLGLVLRGPLLRRRLRIGPGIAAGLGVLILLVSGVLNPDDLADAGEVLWRPLVALASIMVMTGVAARVGLFQRLAGLVLRSGEVPPSRLFGLVFALSFAVAAAFNNDAAILVLTPVVVMLVRDRYPQAPSLLPPFAFAVFLAAGVAPLLTSNPMNTVVAGVAGIDFNTYALRMVPVSVVAAVVTFAVLRWVVFAADFAAKPVAGPPPERTLWTVAQRRSLALVLLVLLAYPGSTLAGLHPFVVATAGAVLALVLAWRHGAGRPAEVLRAAVAWEILVFLLGMFLLAKGLQNVGAVDLLRGLYAATDSTVVGVVSAAGSALINNHSMALINLVAIRDLPGAGEDAYLVALVGGDLGPRLLPIGSLAGLLWLALLRRMAVEVSLRQFVAVGVTVTVPSLAASLAVLALR